MIGFVNGYVKPENDIAEDDFQTGFNIKYLNSITFKKGSGLDQSIKCAGQEVGVVNKSLDNGWLNLVESGPIIIKNSTNPFNNIDSLLNLTKVISSNNDWGIKITSTELLNLNGFKNLLSVSDENGKPKKILLSNNQNLQDISGLENLENGIVVLGK